MKYAVEWTLANGRGQINRYDRHGIGLDLDMAKRYLEKVLARAQHVTGRPFIGKIVIMKESTHAS